MGKFRKYRRLFTLAYLVAAIICSIEGMLASSRPKDGSYSEFIDEAKAGYLDGRMITEQRLIGLPIEAHTPEGNPI